MVEPLGAKRALQLVYLDNNADRTIIMQVVNLSDSLVTFKKDYPLGSIEEIYETLEEDEDSSAHGPNSSEPGPPFSHLPWSKILSQNLKFKCAPRISLLCPEESPQSSDEDDKVHESSQVPKASDKLLDCPV